MITTIILLIDNEQKILVDFISMAKDASNRVELANWLKCWFEDAIEYEKVEVISQRTSQDTNSSYIRVFQHILSAAIQQLTIADWLFMADHYIQKSIESQQ